MAMHKIGLGGVLRFDSRQAEASIARTNRAFGGLQARGQRLGRGLNQAGTAMMGMGFAMMPLIGAAKMATEIYFDFNKQMSAVQAVGQLTEEQFQTLRQEAIKLGGSTAFSATEAASGMEELARAGFNTQEIMSATGAVLNLAAADGMELATAARITANVIKSMGLQAEDAARVTDVLATVSAKSNTDVTALGEAFKIAAPMAKKLGFSVEDTAAMLGKVADAGLRGSVGGTAVKNMMNKLIRPTDKARSIMEDYGIVIEDAHGNMLPMTEVIRNMKNGLSQIPGSMKQSAAAAELTGLRGMAAFTAFADSVGESSSSLDDLADAARQSLGNASRMAEERLNNMAGQFTMLKSAAEGFIIRVLDMFKGLDGSALKPFVDTLQSINEAWDDLSKLIKDTNNEFATMEDLNRKHGSVIMAIVLGIRDGIDIVTDLFGKISTKLEEWRQQAEKTFGPDTIRKIVKISTVILAIAVAAAPVIMALVGIAFIISSVVAPAISAIASILGAVFLPVLVAIGAVIAAYFMLREENESFLGTAKRAWLAIKLHALDFWNNVLKPLWEGIREGAEVIWPQLKQSGIDLFESLKLLVNELIAVWQDLFGKSSTEWKTYGKIAVLVIGTIVNVLVKNLITVIRMITNALRQTRQAFKDIASGNIIQGIRRLGNVVVNALLTPFRLITSVIANLISTLLGIPAVTSFLSDDQVSALQEFHTHMQRFTEKGAGNMPEPPAAYDSVGNFDAGAQALEGYSEDQGLFLSETDEGNFASFDTGSETQNIVEMLDGQIQNIASGVKEGVVEGMGDAKVESTVNSEVCLDGKTVARNQAKHQQDLSDRMGFQTPPFVRRVAAEQGTLPAA